MSSKDRRLDYIFDQLAKKVPSSQIVKNLDQHMEFGLESVKRGNESVEHVVEMLKKTSVVVNIKRTASNSYQDAVLKQDLIVEIINDNNKDIVAGIQVKSCSKELKEFISNYGDTSKERWHNLAEQKLIVLNGQIPQDRMERDFYSQLNRIKSLLISEPEYRVTNRIENIENL